MTVSHVLIGLGFLLIGLFVFWAIVETIREEW